MSSYFPGSKWRLIQLFPLLLINTICLIFKHAHCTWGEGQSSTKVLVSTTTVEVYGITEANLDQMYTQLLLDTDDVKEPGAFIQLNCRLSTFLFAYKIIEIHQHPEQNKKLKGWLKDQQEKIIKSEKKAQKLWQANLQEFHNRLEDFNTLLGERQFVAGGSQCKWDKFFVLGDLCDLHEQVYGYRMDIGQLQIGRRMEESEQAHKARLRGNVGKIHGDTLLQLSDNYMLANSSTTRSTLINRILDQLEDADQMLAMKRRLRLIVGECMFERIELREPIVFRIDLIVPAHLLSLYQKVLSLRVDDSVDDRNALLLQISIPRAVRIILDMKRGQQGEMQFISYFQTFWRENIRLMASNFQGVMSKLTEFWTLQNIHKNNPPIELNELLVKEDRNAVLKLIKTEKLGEMFMQFLNGKKGRKGRLIGMLGYGVDAHKFVLENQELARLLVAVEFVHEKLFKELTETYIEWFTASDTNTDTQKAHLKADVLIEVLILGRKFGKKKTEARDQWALYGAMFLIFLDQLEDANTEFVRNAGRLYKRMLFKLAELVDHNGPMNIETVLSKEFAELTEDCKVGSQTVLVIDLPDEQVEAMIQEDHRSMMTLIKGTEIAKKWERSFNPESRKKWDDFTKFRATSNTSSSSKNPNVIASSAASVSSSFISSYYDCKENEHKTFSILDKGYYQLKAYEYFLTLNGPAQRESEKKIDLYMAIWHYGNEIDKMLSSIRNKFPIEADELTIVWKLTEKLETANHREMMEPKLCKYFRFIYRLYAFIIEEFMRNPGYELATLQSEIRRFVHFPNDNGLTFLNAGNLHCDNADSPGIAEKMINKLVKKKAHFLYLNFLFNEYEVFNVFFCKMQWQIKDKLNELLEPKLLEELERLHPDVLKIHKFQDDVRFYLYDQFVENRKNSREAFAAECRLAVTLALLRLEEILLSPHFLNEHVYDAVLKKVKWVKQLIFANPNELASAKNICLLVSLRTIIKTICIGAADNGQGQNDQVAADIVTVWEGKDCAKPEHANVIMSIERNDHDHEHIGFVILHPNRANHLLQMRGHKARFRRLIPGMEYKYKYAFTSDALVREQIQFALLEKDEEKREMNRLALNFISWARWMDAQLTVVDENVIEHMRQQILREIWYEEEWRQKILRKFDEIFDEHLSDLRGQFGLRLARMQAGLKSMVLNLRLSKEKSKMKLQRKFDEELEPSDESIRLWKGKRNDEFELWLQGLNRKEMLAQLSQAPTGTLDDDDNNKENDGIRYTTAIQVWRLTLKNALEKDKHARKRLLTLFGRVHAEIQPILEAIPLQIDINELGLIVEEPTGDKEAIVVVGKKKHDSKVETSHKPKLHHGHEKSARKANDERKAIGSNQSKAPMSSQIAMRTDESDNVKIGAIADPPKVKEKAEKSLMVENKKSKKVKGKTGMAASSLLASSPSSSPKKTLSLAADERKTSSSTPHVTAAEESSSREIEATTPLLDILRENGYLETPKLKQQIETVVENMKQIVHDWNNDAVLLVGGSYLLQLHTTQSDIDAVLLLPFEEKNANDWIQLCQQQFFGYHQQIGAISDEVSDEAVCDLERPEERERSCTNSSLYCILCKNPAVTVLLRMNGRDGVPMLILKFREIDFDISFVPVSKGILKKFYAVAGSNKKDTLEMSLSSVKNCDILIACFMDWMSSTKNNDNRKGMLLPLSGYRANLYMRELLNVKSTENAIFQPAMLALKLWAKNNFIYGGLFGLFNGSTLTTMLLYVFTKNNQDSVPSLLEDFFDTFYNWKWPEIVELDRALNVDPSEYGGYDWTENVERNERGNLLKAYKYRFLQKEHAKLVWPVIVPGFPTQNAAFNVNGWTKQAILRKFGQALAKMKNLRKQIGAGNTNKQMIRKEWDKWMDGGQFENKYGHFIAIMCTANSAQQVGKFCDFVETRIRLQLLFSFGDLSEKVLQWMHASPVKVRNGLPCPSGEVVAARLPPVVNDDDDGQWLCTIWLVGIQLVEGSESKYIRQLLEDKVIQVERNAAERKEAAVQAQQQSDEKISRLESFTLEIHESFKFKEMMRPPASFSSHDLHNGSNSNLATKMTNSAESSPHGNLLYRESPRASPSKIAAAVSARQSAPTHHQWSMASLSIARQDSMSSPTITRQGQNSMPQFEEAGAVINEKIWAKYLDKSQLRAWLKEMAVV